MATILPPVPTPPPKAAPTPRPAASKPHDNPADARAAERRLLAAMRDHSRASVERLAEIVGAGRSTCGERLRRLAAQALIERTQPAIGGEGRGAAPCAGPYDRVAQLTATPEPQPLELQSPAAHARWVRPIGDYERRETTIVEGLRYG
jgi:hypothetical protein